MKLTVASRDAEAEQNAVKEEDVDSNVSSDTKGVQEVIQ